MSENKLSDAKRAGAYLKKKSIYNYSVGAL